MRQLPLLVLITRVRVKSQELFGVRRAPRGPNCRSPAMSVVPSRDGRYTRFAARLGTSRRGERLMRSTKAIKRRATAVSGSDPPGACRIASAKQETDPRLSHLSNLDILRTCRDETTAHVGNAIVLDRRAFGHADYRNAENVGTWVGPSNHCGLDEHHQSGPSAASLRSRSSRATHPCS